jgi:GT2 family glycosyltransferase
MAKAGGGANLGETPGVAPDATVVIAVYNGAATIEACVSSLLAMSYPRERFEIVVVDNGSGDGTRERLRAFGGAIRVLHEPTRGAAAARNAGVRAARAATVAFTDADCTVEPWWLGALLPPLANPRVGVVGGPILSRVDANRIERFGDRIHDQRRAIEEENPPYVASGNWASRVSVIVDAGYFDETLRRAQDVDLAWRILQAGLELVYAPSAIVRHRNEQTIWGLIGEGYVHGLHGVRLCRKHEAVWPHVRRRPQASGRRLMNDLRRLASGGDPIGNVLTLLFDTGKAAGEWTALARGRRE